MQPAIMATGLGKTFRKHGANRPATWQELVLQAGRGVKRPERFWGLRDLTFTVARGRMFGIIGRNGAGKSTLLRLLGGLFRPDEGTVQVNGRVSGLLDLGAGFHADLTGRENVHIAGVVGGLTRREVTERFETIVEFAELRSVIDAPLRTYSTGMHMRLAFSVAVHVGPQILLVDEVLAVGDLPFQRKCIDRIRHFKVQGCTVIVVSHDLTMVRDLCDDALWLDHGRLQKIGSSDEVVRAYSEDAVQETIRRTKFNESTGPGEGAGMRRIGSREVELASVDVMSSERKLTSAFQSGEPVHVEIAYFAPEAVRDPVFVVSITEEEGRVRFQAATDGVLSSIPVVEGHGRLSLRIRDLRLTQGKYYVDVGVYEKDWKYAYDYHWRVHSISFLHGPSGHTAAGAPNPRADWAVA
jgi:lipopolysaccharide transport system ATP-binding protein